MANFIAEELTAEKVNGGVEYQSGDTPQFNATNAIVKGIMYLNDNAYTKDNVGDLVQEVINALPRAEGSAF